MDASGKLPLTYERPFFLTSFPYKIWVLWPFYFREVAT